MTAGIFVALYIVETVTYYLAYYLFFGKAPQRYYVPVLVAIVFVVFWLLWGRSDLDFVRMAVHFFPIAVAFTVPKVKLRTRITGTIILFFIVNCVSELLMTLADGMLHFTAMDVTKYMKQLIVYSTQLLIFAIIAILKKRLSPKSQSKIKLLAQRNIIYAVIFMAIAMLLAISGLNWAGKRIENPEFQSLSLVICILANIGVCILGLFSIYVDKTNKKMEELMDNEKRLMDMQVRYYDTLLEREEDTRKYRHDMGNHLICMERLVKQQDLHAVENYLSQMQLRMEEIQKRCFSTGNDILDILTNHYVNALGEETEVKVKGRIQTTMDQMQLCTIYANLLQNAVEELERCEGSSLLEVVFTQGKEYFQIAIKNTLSEASKKGNNDKAFATVKKDKRNHGLGLSNVKKTVEDVGGILEIQKGEEFFCAQVSLKVNK